MEWLLLAGMGLAVASGSRAYDGDWGSTFGMFAAACVLNYYGLTAILGAAH